MHLLGQLDLQLSREVSAALLSRKSLNTAGVQGEPLDPAEVRSSLAQRLQLPLEPQASKPSARVEGLIQLLLTATSDRTAPLSIETLQTWHSTLFAAGPDGFHSVAIGELRGDQLMQVVLGPISPETVHLQAPPRQGLEQELQLLLSWFNQPPADTNQADGLIRAGLSHIWFVTLHPFEDCNGRLLARALTDRALAQLSPTGMKVHHAMSLSCRIQQERQAYYLQLERCQ